MDFSIKKFFGKKKLEQNSDLNIKKKDDVASSYYSDWYKEVYESAIGQRNFFILVAFVSIITVIITVLVIRYVKSTKSIEPFVIEIEKKTGIPTVVEPISVKTYSSDEIIKRYFIMTYIKAREEYFYQTFDKNFSQIVRVFSSPEVYYGGYRPVFSPNNPNSPYNVLGKNSTRTVNWKSIIFQSSNLAQVRLSLDTNGSFSGKQDKVVLIGFSFNEGMTMNDDERLINPLGFVVNMYKIENENTSGS